MGGEVLSRGEEAGRWTWDAGQATAVTVLPRQSIRDRISVAVRLGSRSWTKS
jgi:hypothetical protein